MYVREAYDLEIVGVYFKTDDLIKNGKSELDSDDIKYRLVNGLYHIIRAYCLSKKINLETEFKRGAMIIVEPNDVLYFHFIARQLSIIDVQKIIAFLDYQMASYQKNVDKDGLLFVLPIENEVYTLLKWTSVNKKEERLERVMNWVDSRRNFVAHYPPIKKTKTEFPIGAGALDWQGKSENLKDLSKELKAKGFTNNPTDFEKVFTTQTATEWLDNPEYLAYLLEQLYNHSVPQFVASKGGKFKVAQTLFYENVENSRNYFNLSNLLYNVITRQAVKHRHLRDRVDKLISEFIK